MKNKIQIQTIIFILLFLTIFLMPNIFNILVDWHWFANIGYLSVFKTIIWSQILIGIIAGIISFLIIFLNLLISQKTAKSSDLSAKYIEINPVKKIAFNGINKLKIILTLILSIIIGIACASNWEVILKYFNSTSFGLNDPIFGKDISFYFFQLPFFQFFISLCFWLIIFSFIGVMITYSLRGLKSLKSFDSFLIKNKRAKIHLSILAGLFFLLIALNINFVKIPSLLYSSTGPFIGASYTDIHAILPFLKISIIFALLVACLCILSIFKSSNKWIIYSIGLYFVISILGGTIYPAMLQRFIVLPNELVKETPYMEHHIAATRKAFGIDNIIERNLKGEASLTIEDINNNQSTIKNVRLWDREPLLDTFSQIQEIRTYYDFVSVDNDRYQLNGDYRQVLLSPRELNSYSLPQRNFINEHLTFTHGFGLTLSPVNEVTSEGLPVLLIKDLPPVSSIDSLLINDPEIYYGELSNEYVVVKTNAKEFDYPSGEENIFTNYSGSGGVKINSFFRKALFAIKFGSLKILLSNDINNDSRIMYYRDIRTRVKKVLPFLKFDNDPYLVIGKEGDLKWIYDAYTVSNKYPYSIFMTGFNDYQSYISNNINYIRNSVKIVIDAYNGDIKVYISDKNDPIIQTYAKIFKDLFMPIEEMNTTLREHTRYPEDLFDYQTKLYSTYHMDKIQIFYNKEDQWVIPSRIGLDTDDPMMRRMIMKLPEEDKEEFILMIPFTPRGKDNLAAWMVARNDNEKYGELIIYKFPKQRLIFGPTQINNRINQDTEVSQQLTLWDQRGSEVIKGNLLVIPIEESLIYVQPIYLRAEGGKIPELKRVIVAYEKHIVMAEDLDTGLAEIFGNNQYNDKIDKQETITAPTTNDLIKQAQKYFEEAIQAQQQGDWSKYGTKLENLGNILKKLK
ncbi:UPF0182 family protein [Patescibacteria group bacterium]|nr:UPF0182 family protein [Patescibacteria group bacterium]